MALVVAGAVQENHTELFTAFVVWVKVHAPLLLLQHRLDWRTTLLLVTGAMATLLDPDMLLGDPENMPARKPFQEVVVPVEGDSLMR